MAGATELERRKWTVPFPVLQRYVQGWLDPQNVPAAVVFAGSQQLQQALRACGKQGAALALQSFVLGFSALDESVGRAAAARARGCWRVGAGGIRGKPPDDSCPCLLQA